MNFDYLTDCLPVGFEDVSELLKQSQTESENAEQITQSAIALIEGKLSNNSTEQWLFAAGRALANANKNIRNDEELRREVAQNLHWLMQTAPANISKNLLLKIEKITVYLENNQTDEYNPATESCEMLTAIIENMNLLGRIKPVSN